MNTYNGGICGDNDGYIIGCYNLTAFSSSHNLTGGIAGMNDEDSYIIGCYSKSGNITEVGGLLGLNWGTLLNSYFEITETVTLGIKLTQNNGTSSNVFGISSDNGIQWNIDGDETTNNAMYTMNKAIEEISATVTEAAGWYYEENTDEATKATIPLIMKYTQPATE